MLPYFNQIQRNWQHRAHKTQYEDKRKKNPQTTKKQKQTQKQNKTQHRKQKG
jgi:hypothetical protein